MNSIGPIGGCAGSSTGALRPVWQGLAVAVCLLLADCAHMRSGAPAPPPAPRRPPTRVVAPPSAPAVLSESDLPAARGRASRALVSGGQAAVVPEDAGYFLDVLQGRLLQRIGDRFAISRRGDALVLRPLAGAAWFAADGTLTAEGQASLTTMAAVLTEYRRTLVVVRAYAGNLGDARQRALAVARVLSSAKLDRRRVLPVAVPGSGPALEIQLEPVTASR